MFPQPFPSRHMLLGSHFGAGVIWSLRAGRRMIGTLRVLWGPMGHQAHQSAPRTSPTPTDRRDYDRRRSRAGARKAAHSPNVPPDRCAAPPGCDRGLVLLEKVGTTRLSELTAAEWTAAGLEWPPPPDVGPTAGAAAGGVGAAGWAGL